MTAFKGLLAALCACIVVYTAFVAAEHGLNLLSVFFGDIAAMGWPGQFNVDFLSFLVLSACWVAWRHEFSAPGLGLAVIAFFGGGLFLTVYLLVVLRKAKGDMAETLMGRGRARALRG